VIPLGTPAIFFEPRWRGRGFELRRPPQLRFHSIFTPACDSFVHSFLRSRQWGAAVNTLKWKNYGLWKSVIMQSKY